MTKPGLVLKLATCSFHLARHLQSDSMLRRIASLLFIPVLLANQAAMCCAHIHHSGSEVEDHSQRAHVHFAGHDHSHDHDHSDHQIPLDESSPDDADSVLKFETSCHSDHDNDAIYLNDRGEFRNQTTQLTLEGISPGPVMFAEKRLAMVIPVCRNRVIRAISFLPYHCPVYLQTCCLLI